MMFKSLANHPKKRSLKNGSKKVELDLQADRTLCERIGCSRKDKDASRISI